MSIVRLSKSCIGEEEKMAVGRVLDHEFLGMGEEVRLFEEELRDFIGTDMEVVCVSSGTAALHLALSCLDVGPGDEVLVPSITYVATFQAISATGATPIACDVREESAFLDVRDAARRVTPRTRAIFPVHYASDSSGVPEVYNLARQTGLRVVEDAAHSFGCERGGKRIGSEGDVVCFSFDGIKNITSGEGGALVTGDRKLASRVRDARLLGVEKDTEARFRGERSWDFDVGRQGYRYHMSNIMAAIGRVQLKRFDGFASRRIELAQRYVARLRNVPHIRTFDFPYGSVVPHIFPILVGSGRRDRVLRALEAAGIQCGIHYKPNHFLSYYKEGHLSLPVSEILAEELITLPLHPDLEDQMFAYVVANLIRAVSDQNCATAQFI